MDLNRDDIPGGESVGSAGRGASVGVPAAPASSDLILREDIGFFSMILKDHEILTSHGDLIDQLIARLALQSLLPFQRVQLRLLWLILTEIGRSSTFSDDSDLLTIYNNLLTSLVNGLENESLALEEKGPALEIQPVLLACLETDEVDTTGDHSQLHRIDAFSRDTCPEFLHIINFRIWVQQIVLLRDSSGYLVRYMRHHGNTLVLRNLRFRFYLATAYHVDQALITIPITILFPIIDRIKNVVLPLVPLCKQNLRPDAELMSDFMRLGNELERLGNDLERWSQSSIETAGVLERQVCLDSGGGGGGGDSTSDVLNNAIEKNQALASNESLTAMIPSIFQMQDALSQRQQGARSQLTESLLLLLLQVIEYIESASAGHGTSQILDFYLKLYAIFNSNIEVTDEKLLELELDFSVFEPPAQVAGGEVNAGADRCRLYQQPRPAPSGGAAEEAPLDDESVAEIGSLLNDLT